MTMESYLSKQMQKFSILDLGMVKMVYFVFGLFIYSFYPTLAAIDWWFYFILALIAAMPLWLHMFSLKGDVLAKTKKYIKTNNPSNQILLCFSMFFFALMLGTLFPALVSASWWVYFVIMALLSIKPLTVTWCW